MKKIFTLLLAASTLFYVGCEEKTEIKIDVESVELNKEATTLSIDDTESLTVTVLPSNAEDLSVTWSSSNSDIATVSDAGLVTAVADGEATITVSSNSKPSLLDKCVVTVKAGYALTMSEPTAEIKLGDAFQLSFTYTPEDYEAPEVVWSSDNEEIAVVTSDGYVTGVAAGVANIFVACADDPTIKASCAVTVTYDPTMDLASFNTDTYPETDTWYIGSDEFPSASNFDGLTAALQSAYDLDNSRKISLEFNDLKYIPAEVFNEGRAPESLYSLSAPVVEDVTDYAFYGAESIVNISVPNVKTIGYYSFNRCSSLETVDVTAVESISDGAFAESSSLISFTANNLTQVGHYIFEDCSSLESVAMPLIPNVTDYMFSSCSSLVDLDLASIVGINSGAFEKCKSLTAVDFPLVKELGSCVFDNCTSLETVNFPELEHAEDAVFAECSALKSANLPKLAYQYYMTFAGCSSLEEITIGTECVITCVGDDYGDVFDDVDLSNVTLITGAENGTIVLHDNDVWEWVVPYDGDNTVIYSGFKEIIVK